MNTSFAKALLSILLICLLLACSSEKKQENIPTQNTTTLSLQENETLENLIDKILAAYISQTLASAQNQQTATDSQENLNPTNDFPPIMDKRQESIEALKNAYTLNKSYQNDKNLLENITTLYHQWQLLSSSAAPYIAQGALHKLQTDITLSLAAFLLDYQDDNLALTSHLEEQYQAAKGSGELNTIVETQIQVQIIAFFGFYQLHSQKLDNAQTLETLHNASSLLKEKLTQFKDFLPKTHYQVYEKAYDLLNSDLLIQQAPMDRILTKLMDYLPNMEEEIGYVEEYHGHTQRLKNAYDIAKNYDFSNAQVQDIITIAQNPSKNSYDTQEVANYLYGIDYLTLALLHNDVQNNVENALGLLKKDFLNLQIAQHTFSPTYFQNYLSSLFLAAYALNNAAQGKERFEELLRTIDSNLQQYADTISKEDMQLYEDALKTLKQVDTTKFLRITLEASTPTQEEAYFKIPLELSPDELNTLKAIMAKEQLQRQSKHELMQDSTTQSSTQNQNTNETNTNSVCLNIQDINFMLSLAYQAMKTQGYEGVSPDMFNIRLEEVLGISSLKDQSHFIDDSNKEWGKEYLIDYDSFLFLFDKGCEIQALLIDGELMRLEDRQQICAQGIFFNKDNGFITDKILPSHTIEILADDKVFYRLKKVDLALNKLIFKNDENAIADLVEQKNNSTLLPTLKAYFAQITNYFNNRSQKLQALLLNLQNVTYRNK